MSNVLANVFNIAHYTIHDGPGIRTTVFFKGCPMNCLWCCSPESQSGESEIAWNKSVCSSCGRCYRSCRYGAVAFEGKSMLGIDRLRCVKCGACSDVCPDGAIKIVGRSFTAEQLFNEVHRDAPFWRRSGGGVTLSGGEVLDQPVFAEAFLDLCRKHFVHSAIETCLFAPFATVKKITDKTDFILFDLKAMDPVLHRKLTGQDNKNILENASYLLESSKTVVVRFPLIPGINDGIDNLELLGSYVAAHRKGAAIEVLPYHSMGVGGYEMLGRNYLLQGVLPPTKAQMLRITEILNGYPVKVIYS